MSRSALRPTPLRLGRAVPASIGLHASVAFALFAWESFQPEPEPMIDLDEVVMVSLAPAKATGLPDKASRAPDPIPQPDPTPEAVIEPVEPPPPTASDMVEHVEEAEPKPPQTVDHSSRREELLRQMRREQALADIADAPVGAEDRQRTDPDGVEGGSGSSVGVGDPALAAYVEKLRQALLPNFHPIQTEALETWIAVQIDESGKIVDYSIHKKSGDASYDAAALRAVMKAGQVPPPPPEYLELALQGLSVRFSNQDML